MASLILVGTMLCLMAARVAGPFGPQARGAVVAEHRMGLRERMLLHRHSLYALGAVLLLGAVTGTMPRGVELIGMVGAFALALGLPAVYHLTEEGVGLNTVVFRPWSEFDGVQPVREGLRLTGKPGMGRFTIVCLAGPNRERLHRLSGERLHCSQSATAVRAGAGHASSAVTVVTTNRAGNARRMKQPTPALNGLARR